MAIRPKRYLLVCEKEQPNQALRLHSVREKRAVVLPKALSIVYRIIIQTDEPSSVFAATTA